MQSSGTGVHLDFELLTCDFLMCTMDNLRLIVSDLMEEFISIHRGSYMSALVLLNLLNELEKRVKMQGVC